MANELLQSLVRSQDSELYRTLTWEGSFEQYLDQIRERPHLAQTAYQRIYNMILSYGSEEYTENKEKITRYHFFADPFDDGRDAVYGLDRALMHLVQIFKSAARGYGTEKRVLLLHGPVGSSKSTIVRLLKKGLEAYSRTDEGALFSFVWCLEDGTTLACPMNEDPLHLVPTELRNQLERMLNEDRSEEEHVHIRGDLCPMCRFMFREELKKHNGDWHKVLSGIKVSRLVLSEQDRIGIGTFQPKDEKNQDSTELTGDINYRKIAEYGSESDPRAFNFDGEFNIANRGLIEFVEVLKLDVAFLYDLLGASQEHKIKPKRFPQTDIDEVIIGHTNSPEYKKLQNNEFMEALRDRTVKVDVPYNTRLADEIRIYERDYNSKKIKGKHIAPHTIEIAAMWGVLTRLEEPNKADLSLLQKLKLYDGKTMPGYTDDNIRELKQAAKNEGMEGISPRYIQDKISNALVSDAGLQADGTGCVNPFMVLHELEGGLAHHSLITSEDVKKRFRELLSVVKSEYEDIVKSEVQRAISADEEALKRLSGNYIDNLNAYISKEKVKNRFTGADEEPDERLMRSIEEKIDIPESRKDDFRREIMNYIGSLALQGKTFRYDSNQRLHKALELKLFEDQKDSIKLTSIVSNVVDKDTQEKIEIVKSRLINEYGYCDICANDVLQYVASIFARGDVRK
jgi:serine protein kinase